MTQRLLQPIKANILVSVQQKADTTAGGIVLTEKSKQLRPDEAAFGMAVAVGEKARDVLPGFKVFVKPHMGYHYRQDGLSFLVVDEKHILAVIPPDGVTV